MIDLTVETSTATSLDTIIESFREASRGSMAGVLDVTDEELVSSDLLGSRFSTTVDTKACMELNSRVSHITYYIITFQYVATSD
jgi:glyceraldehyde 3-phosphate dehydrogenase